MKAISAGFLAGAMVCLVSACTISPASARAGRGEAVACFDKDPDAAIAGCSAIISTALGKLDPHNRSVVYVMRGYAFMNKANYDSAIRDFDEAIRTDPKSVQAYFDRAVSYFGKRDYDRSITDFDEAIRLDPNMAVAYSERGHAYSEKEDFEHARRDLDEAIRLDPKIARAHLYRGETFAKQSDFDRAIADLSEAIRLDPKDWAAYSRRSMSYAGKGDYDAAMRDLDEAIRLNPKRADLYNEHSYYNLQTHQYDRAIADAEEALRADPNLVAAYDNRGSAFSYKGDYARAIIDFNEALRLDPNETVVYVDRGKAFEKQGNIDRAKADFSTALARPPKRKEPETLKTLEEARQHLAALDAQTQAPVSAPAAAALPPVTPPAAEQGPRVALVIGNGAYANVPPLLNPPNDAHDIASALRNLGFKVIEGYDLDGTKMRGKIAEFGAALPGAGVALFYYAGHGMQVSGKNYLVPTDAKLERPSALSTEAIEVDSVLADMETEKRVNLVFLDACRDNPLSKSLARSFGASRSSAVAQGLAQLNSGIGTLITFATSPDTVALDGDGRNSPFTTALLKYIGAPGLEIRSMLTRVRADVIQTTHEKQVPWDHSSLTGDFYFRPGG